MELIGRGFVTGVSRFGDKDVKKIPLRKGASLDDAKRGYEIHKEYLGERVLDTTFVEDGDSYYAIQRRMDGGHVDLRETLCEDVRIILEKGIEMGAEEKVLFDVFGISGVLRLLDFYYPNDTKLGKAKSIVLPRIGLSAEKFKEFDDRNPSPFTSPNIMDDSEGRTFFIDTDYKPLNFKHPFNVAGDAFTKRVLRDLGI